MNYDLLRAELTRDEGKVTDNSGRHIPYKDSVGIFTVAYGRNLSRGLSEDEAKLLLENDIKEHERLLDKYLPWWRKMNEVRQRALLNMAFNLGVGPSLEQPNGKLLTFKNTLANMEKGDYVAAADGMGSSKWAQQVGQRAVRLVKMMMSGVD